MPTNVSIQLFRDLPYPVVVREIPLDQTFKVLAREVHIIASPMVLVNRIHERLIVAKTPPRADRGQSLLGPGLGPLSTVLEFSM
jgi:hypothetical protein